MYFFFICFILPIIDAFVAVKIYRNALYNPFFSCAFIRNASWLNNISIESCIWECVNEYHCQTAIFFKDDQICSMFKEECHKGSIQSSANAFISVICYKKNRNPMITCSSTLSTNERNEESSSVFDIITTTEIVELPTTIKTISRLTHANDPIFGICNTTTGGDSTPSNESGYNQCNFYPGEIPSYAIDNNSSTKYTNFGNGTLSTWSITHGCYTGFYVTPSNGPSVLHAVQFSAANDLPDRDPITITIEGTNSTSLTIGNSWSLIYSGSSGLDNDPGRYSLGIKQILNNTIVYTSYRLLIITKRASERSVQYSEAILLGYY